MNRYLKYLICLVVIYLNGLSIVAKNSILQLEGTWTTTGEFKRNNTPSKDNIQISVKGINAGNLEFWGSWGGSDANIGSIVSPAFIAPEKLGLFVSGSPSYNNCELYLENISNGDKFELEILKKEHIADFEIYYWILPENWVGDRVKIIARDNSKEWGGWLGISNPFHQENITTETLKPVQFNRNEHWIDSAYFKENGAYPDTYKNVDIADFNARSIRFYGSWLGSDNNLGKITSPSFALPKVLGLFCVGLPGHEGNSVYLKDVKTGEKLALYFKNKYYHTVTYKTWGIADSWASRRVVLVGEDNSEDFAGWFGISTPIEAVSSLGSFKGIADYLEQKNGIYYTLSFLFYLLVGAMLLIPEGATFFRILLFLGILFIRLPGILYPFETNVDESLMITQAITLLDNPIFWKSVDGTTGGPMLSYILLLPKLLGFEIHYFSARLIGILLIIFAGHFLYLGIKNISDVVVAKVGLFVYFSFAAFTTYMDFTHYSSEHFPILLLSLTFYSITKCFLLPNNYKYYFFLGNLVVLFFLSKLQALPIAFGFYIWLLSYSWLTKGVKFLLNKILILIKGFLALFFPFLLALYYFDLWEDFYLLYIYNNLFIYIPSEISQSDHIYSWYHRLMNDPTIWEEFTLPFGIPLLVAILGLISAFIYKASQNRKRSGDKVKTNLVLPKVISKRSSKLSAKTLNQVMGFFLIFLTIYAILKPGQSFTHYLLLGIIPLCIWIGLLFNQVKEMTSSKMSFIFIIKCIIFLALGYNIFGSLTFTEYGLRPTRFYNDWLENELTISNLWKIPEIDFIKANTNGQDKIVSWGFDYKYHVYSQLPQGSRFGQKYYLVSKKIPSDLQVYYCTKFLQDLVENEPKILVDFEQTSFQDLNQSLPISKDILNYIETNYYKKLVGTSNLYIRKL